MNILMTIDGVLRGGQTQGTIRDGVLLYWALKENNQVTLLTDDDYESTHRWLAVNGLSDYDGLMGNEIELPGESIRQAQIRVAKSRGAVAMLVDPDPHVIASVYDHGITGLLFVAPKFAAVQYRPDAPRKARSWAEIERAITEHLMVKSKTKFADGAEIGGFE